MLSNKKQQKIWQKAYNKAYDKEFSRLIAEGDFDAKSTASDYAKDMADTVLSEYRKGIMY
jgi:hypothetical protein